jgi:anti-sigma B factor antagonist
MEVFNMNLEIKKEEHKEAIILLLEGEVDVYTAPKLKEELMPLVEKENHEVRIDLSHVEYMDSTGLGVIIGALKCSKSKQGQLKLCNATARLNRLFEITGLVEVMDIRQGEEI